MPENQRNEAETLAIALREAAVAVLQTELPPGKPDAKVTIVPVGYYMSFVLTEPKEGNALETAEATENRITALLAGPAVAAVFGHEEGPDSSAAFAMHLAEKLADNTVPAWRQSDPDSVNRILGRCFERAKQLVTTHEARIRKVAAELAQKGTVPVSRVQSIH